MLRLSSSVFALISVVMSAPHAFAEDAAFDVEANDDSRTIIVTGISDGYLASNSVTATKTDTPLIDIPQTINVVTREQLDDQAHHSLADILRYVPGT
ncbi:MAG: TonB-dependent receptor plug domain-containing protein, partial [Sphingorhabdus sp.]